MHDHGHRMNGKHMLLMLGLCLLPLTGLAIVRLLGVAVDGSAVFFLLMLACPLSHLFLMRGMDHPRAAKQEIELGEHAGEARDMTKQD